MVRQGREDGLDMSPERFAGCEHSLLVLLMPKSGASDNKTCVAGSCDRSKFIYDSTGARRTGEACSPESRPQL